MVPNKLSIYRFCSAVPDIDGIAYLTEAPPFRYVELADTRLHTVAGRDTWHGLAARYYPAHAKRELLAKVIADFQPVFVEDMSVEIDTGAVVHIPSSATIDDLILSERRRPEYEA